MPRFLVPLPLIAVVAVALSAALAAPPAKADSLSPGCQEINNPYWDAEYGDGLPDTLDYAAGELITASAGKPASHNPRATEIALYSGATAVGSSGFPGTVTYQIPASGSYAISWKTDSGNVTWTLSCTGPPSPSPDPAQEITDLQQTVTGLGLHKGLTTALNAKLEAALGYLDAGDTADACDSLTAFLNQVSAQTGKKLDESDAQELTAAATAIQTELGC